MGDPTVGSYPRRPVGLKVLLLLLLQPQLRSSDGCKGAEKTRRGWGHTEQPAPQCSNKQLTTKPCAQVARMSAVPIYWGPAACQALCRGQRKFMPSPCKGGGYHNCPHFIERETEAQMGRITSLTLMAPKW